jgi:PilZ domain
MPTPEKERRRFIRVRFRNPLRAAIGDAPLFVVDASAAGIGVAHEIPLPAPGRICRVEVLSDIGPIKLDCAIVRTVKRTANDAAKAVFHSGLEVIAAADPQSQARLRSVTQGKR